MRLWTIEKGSRTQWTLALLTLAMTISVFTEKRFITGIGVSELIVLGLGAYQWKRSRHLFDADKGSYFLTKYFHLVAPLIPLGIAWNLLTVNSTFQMVHDLLAFCFSWYLTAWVLQKMVKVENTIDIIRLFLLFGIVVNVWYLLMYRNGVGFFFSSHRFCGYSSDPNQVAEALILTPWLTLFLLREEKRQGRVHPLHYVLAVISIYLAIQVGWLTDSDSFMVAMYFSVATWICAYAILRNKPWIFLVLFVGLALVVMLTDYSVGRLLADADGYYRETALKDNQMNTRLKVWMNGLKAFLHSPLFGNGPGAHSGNWAPFGNVESHNTYIYILMNHGIMGFLVLGGILMKIVKQMMRNKDEIMFAAFAGMLIFCFFHSFQRMPLFWFYLMLFYVICSLDRGQDIQAHHCS